MPHLSRRSFVQGAALLTLGSAFGCRTVAPADRRLVRYEFFRNATAKLRYGDLTLLLDPMLSPKGALPSFAGIAPNPTVDLLTAPETIIEGIDGVVVSHLHADHFDQAAADLLDKDIPVITPRNSAAMNPADPATRASFKTHLEAYGFRDVQEIAGYDRETLNFRGMTLHQVWGRHGEGQIGDLIGGVNGIVFTADNLPTIYWVGDTVLDEQGHIEAVLQQFRPDVVIAHTGGPKIEAVSPELLLMDAEQGARFFEMAHRYNPDVRGIAVHMEALDHCFSTRDDLQKEISALPQGLQDRIRIPLDGDTVNLS